MKNRQKAAMLFLTAILGVGIGSRAYAADDRRIVFLGDSLTAGYQLDLDESYPLLIQQKIKQAQLPFTVVNSGISGDTTAGGLRRIDWLLRQRVDLILIALGANDGLRGLPVESMKTNLAGMIEKVRAKSPSSRILLAGMLLPENMGSSYKDEFDAAFRAVADAQHVPLMPFLLEGVAGQPGLNLPDGIHPNAEGQRIIAENVWNFISPVLREIIAADGRATTP